MSYTKQTWDTGDLITAAKMNHIEDGIEAASEGGSGSGLPEATTADVNKVLTAAPVYEESFVTLLEEQTIHVDNTSTQFWDLAGDSSLFTRDAVVHATINGTAYTGVVNYDLVCGLYLEGTPDEVYYSIFGSSVPGTPLQIYIYNIGDYTISATISADVVVGANPEWDLLLPTSTSSDIGKVLKVATAYEPEDLFPLQSVDASVSVSSGYRAYLDDYDYAVFSTATTLTATIDGASCHGHLDNDLRRGWLWLDSADDDGPSSYKFGRLSNGRIYMDFPDAGEHTVHVIATDSKIIGTKSEWQPAISVEEPDIGKTLVATYDAIDINSIVPKTEFDYPTSIIGVNLGSTDPIPITDVTGFDTIASTRITHGLVYIDIVDSYYSLQRAFYVKEGSFDYGTGTDFYGYRFSTIPTFDGTNWSVHHIDIIRDNSTGDIIFVYDDNYAGRYVYESSSSGGSDENPTY